MFPQLLLQQAVVHTGVFDKTVTGAGISGGVTGWSYAAVVSGTVDRTC